MDVATFDDPVLWLDLLQIPGLGATQLKQLHQALVGPRLFEHDLSAALCEAGLAEAGTEAVLRRLQETGQRQGRERLHALCQAWREKPGQQILTLASTGYPPLLYEISDPPPVLFVRGNSQMLGLPQIGIVGSRAPSADGRRIARDFSSKLVAAGYRITSGLALGIDGVAHLAALDAGGETIAVLGCGLDRIYPAEHRRLADRIAANGALVSEFPPGTEAEAWHFPRRNRIISGLAHGVVVVEAAQRSGSLITARLAAGQGREVFAVPGSIHNPKARGCHRLIRQGAKLVESVADILEEVPALLQWERAREDTGQQTPAREPRDPRDKELLAALGYDPLGSDELLQACGLSPGEAQARLVQLELDGFIERHAGGWVLSRS